MISVELKTRGGSLADLQSALSTQLSSFWYSGLRILSTSASLHSQRYLSVQEDVQALPEFFLPVPVLKLSRQPQCTALVSHLWGIIFLHFHIQCLQNCFYTFCSFFSFIFQIGGLKKKVRSLFYYPGQNQKSPGNFKKFFENPTLMAV